MRQLASNRVGWFESRQLGLKRARVCNPGITYTSIPGFHGSTKLPKEDNNMLHKGVMLLSDKGKLNAVLKPRFNLQYLLLKLTVYGNNAF